MYVEERVHTQVGGWVGGWVEDLFTLRLVLRVGT